MDFWKVWTQIAQILQLNEERQSFMQMSKICLKTIETCKNTLLKWGERGQNTNKTTLLHT